MISANNYSRSNVNERMLSVSEPTKSGFDMSHEFSVTPRLGVFMPVAIENIIPGDTFSGSSNINLTLEKTWTPQIGKIRLDTHHFFVSRRRINRDFRTFIASGAHGKVMSAPSADIYEACEYLINAVFALGYGDWSFNMSDSLDSIPSYTLGQLFLDQAGTCMGARDFVSTVIAGYELLLIAPYRFGFTEDFIRLEISRLQSYFDTIPDTSDYYSPLLAIKNVLQSYIGRGSICDMYGYPTYTTYRVSVYQSLNQGGVRIPQTVFSRTLGQVLHISEFQRMPGSQYDRVVEDNVGPKCLEQLYSAYSCWYDYMRDYHIEPSGANGLLDPDLFDSTPLLRGGMPVYEFISNFLQLMVPRWRYWSRDPLTTIQPDDVYRKVYSPISAATNGALSTSSIESPDSEAALNAAIDMIIDGEQIPFISNALFYSRTDQGVVDTLRADLQRMRRAGYEERWLARNFYHPDTFSGQIEAHYSVSPVDMGILQAYPLKGSEAFISGEQLKSSVGTEDTPVGTRTFTGGGSVQDSFSLNTTEFGYLCSFVSLVPIRVYDAANMHLDELTNADIPLPEFAVDTRCEISGGDMIRGLSKTVIAGYVPRYPQYRSRLDEAHGLYLEDYRAFDFIGDQFTMWQDSQSQGEYGAFVLSPYLLRAHASHDCFVGLKEYDSVAYGKCAINLSVNRALPAAVEFV